MNAQLCRCGSGQEWYPLHDARGIFVAYVCDRCKQARMATYRPEVFTNPQYETDEPIEPEEW
jgi:hypothetical protein